MTVSEVAAAGVAALFVPFPHADRRQPARGDRPGDGHGARPAGQRRLAARIDRHRLVAGRFLRHLDRRTAGLQGRAAEPRRQRRARPCHPGRRAPHVSFRRAVRFFARVCG
ncbi:hypothetical protein BMR85_024990 [Achromobacter sp. KAs 3-5]|nr:hypothetical protein BMR85_024990 [Achromobacter sp. KAs 3-5]